MNRFWSMLFLLVPTLAVGSFGLMFANVGPLAKGRWPIVASDSTAAMDQLFENVHLLAAVILVGTGGTIAWIVWRNGASSFTNRKAQYFSGNLKLELVWSVVPAGILIFLACYQTSIWQEQKLNRPVTRRAGQEFEVSPMVRVIAKQFGWTFQYAGPDEKFQTTDDLFVENLMVVPAHEPIVMQLTSRDVIHSMYIPDLRFKQDIVPGRDLIGWFQADRSCDSEIFCSELCGSGHYRMKAILKIVEHSDFESWIDAMIADQQPRFAD